MFTCRVPEAGEWKSDQKPCKWRTKVFDGHWGLKHLEDSFTVSGALSTVQKWFEFACIYRFQRVPPHPYLSSGYMVSYMRNRYPKQIPWIGLPRWTGQKQYVSLGRSRIHMGKGITWLWLKTSGRDLNYLQRTHAETGLRRWLKTRCYDLTLPFVVTYRVWKNCSEWLDMTQSEHGSKWRKLPREKRAKLFKVM